MFGLVFCCSNTRDALAKRPEAIFVFRTQPSPVGVLGERDLSRDEASPASRGEEAVRRVRSGTGDCRPFRPCGPLDFAAITRIPLHHHETAQLQTWHYLRPATIRPSSPTLPAAATSAYAAAGTTAGGAGPGPYQSAQAGEDHPRIGREPDLESPQEQPTLEPLLSQTEVVSGFAGDPRNGDGETEAPPPHYWIVPDGPVECRQLDRAAPHDSRAMCLAHGERISLPATGVKFLFETANSNPATVTRCGVVSSDGIHAQHHAFSGALSDVVSRAAGATIAVLRALAAQLPPIPCHPCSCFNMNARGSGPDHGGRSRDLINLCAASGVTVGWTKNSWCASFSGRKNSTM
ncbi:hypothetical protein PAPYR_12147 [Paratrimastix pyriformis]|uniref:Uncharacterized protein n=1 Tax=Paratrimastix pyriformis TaxID=342808 RepID=A0ABQ8U2D4_9EUKA|nr:hypothetical protein PAPYR_12147 [Paratrimastix pyriformis]